MFVLALVSAVEAGEAAHEGEQHQEEDDAETDDVVQHTSERHQQRPCEQTHSTHMYAHVIRTSLARHSHVKTKHIAALMY